MTGSTTLSAESSTRADAWRPLGFVPALDGIRAIAVIIVVAYHGLWFGLEGGFIGVDVFFVLSGFLITRLLVDEHERRGSIGLRKFYIRRGLRLLPALFGVVAGVWLIAALFDAPSLEERLVPRSLWALSYVANWRDVVTGTHSGPFAHLWSLSVEEQFYVLWPLVVVVLLRRGGPTTLRRVALGLALVAGATTVVRHWTGGSGFEIYFGTHSHGAVLLLAGSWLGANPGLLRKIDERLAVRLMQCGAVAIGALAFAPDRFSDIHAGLGYVPVGAASLALIAGAVAHKGTSPLTWRPLRWIGRSSYAIYLWHIPMFRITADLVPNVDPRLRIVIGTAIGVTISHYLIERPSIRLKHRWSA